VRWVVFARGNYRNEARTIFDSIREFLFRDHSITYTVIVVAVPSE
jgi:hypothetical protein